MTLVASLCVWRVVVCCLGSCDPSRRGHSFWPQPVSVCKCQQSCKTNHERLCIFCQPAFPDICFFSLSDLFVGVQYWGGGPCLCVKHLLHVCTASTCMHAINQLFFFFFLTQYQNGKFSELKMGDRRSGPWTKIWVLTSGHPAAYRSRVSVADALFSSTCASSDSLVYKV